MITVRPDDIVLAPNRHARKDQLIVQPDAAIETAGTYCLIEAKRIRSSSFQPKQLAREYVAAIKQAQARTPLLLLILGTPPPVKVTGLKDRVSVAQAIEPQLSDVAAAVEGLARMQDIDLGRIPNIVAWTTWHTTREAVAAEARLFPSSDPSVAGTIQRLAQTLLHAIDRHS